ncbi:GAF and ANTAR domain-containing protein [Nocardioides lentus]|uniref:GAF and ANTAR domain-containing protein n=1 Tax=Nocardioides lentus TaxID=338077 RepID=A0ABP5A5M3_9ACTN
MISVRRVTRILVEVAALRGGAFDLVPFLAVVAGHAADASGAAVVGLALTDRDGTLRPLAASGGTAAPGRVDGVLALLAERGPHSDCAEGGRPVVRGDLGGPGGHWAAFAAGARGLGLTRVHALPLRVGEETIGALVLLAGPGAPYAVAEVDTVRALAELTTVTVLRERRLALAEETARQLREALESRVVVEQAKGVLAERERITVDVAFARLRGTARSSNRRLVDVARDVIAGVAGS